MTRQQIEEWITELDDQHKTHEDPCCVEAVAIAEKINFLHNVLNLIT